MYSETLIADLQALVKDTYDTGDEIDPNQRVIVEIGRVLSMSLGLAPGDRYLARFAEDYGTPVPHLTRGAVHILPPRPDNLQRLVGIGLGQGRGVIETAGDRLVRILNPSPSRYTAVHRIPNVTYGGLL